MNNAPYPGYSPSYKIVDETGGMKRTCLVIEILSLGQLDNLQMAIIQEQLEACVDKFKQSIVVIENAQLVMPNRFDPVLKSGLRLS